MDPEKWKAQTRQHRGRRRARKYAARIAGPVPAKTYAEILASGPCVYCAAPAVHVDHVRPLSRGGFEHEDNLVPACAPCNQSKRSSLLIGWDPVRVAHGVASSPKVAAEYDRLMVELIPVVIALEIAFSAESQHSEVA